MNEKVSIIIPIYKVEKYIRHCIESILNQTYRNLEIILVDDGSPDNCPNICDEYAERDSRIKVIHKPNGGLSDARNAGLKVFTGDYVYFFDGDDYVENTLIEIALKNALETCADLVVFNYYRVDEADNLLSTSYFKTGIYEITDHNRINYIVNTLAKYETGWEAWNRLYKADIIRTNQLFFWDNKVIFAEDFGFSLNFALHANKISCISDVLYHYLIRKNSIMSEASKIPRLSASIALSKLMEEKISSTFEQSILQKEFPVLFYSIMYEQLRGLTIENYKTSIASINDNEYFNKNMKRVIGKFVSIIKCYGVIKGSIVLLICFCLLTRRFEKLNIRVLESYKKRWKISEVFENNKAKMSSKKRVFLIGSEDFRNLGDHHLAISEMEYLQNVFPDYEIIEITASEYYTVRHMLSFLIKRKDLLCISGGSIIGKFSSLTDYIQRDMMKRYKNNRMIIFPQSTNYDSSEDEIMQLKKYQTMINKSRKITMCFSDYRSYELAKQYFDCNIVLTPDMVLYSNYSNQLKLERKGAIIILNNELEGTQNEQDKLLIEKIVGQYTEDIRFNDIVLNSDISVFDRKDVVAAFMKKIAEAELVITNRLEGMLFCAITQTPCIVLPNCNRNAEEVYEWLSKTEYIIIIKDLNDLEEALDRLLAIDNLHYDNSRILEGIESLTKILKSYKD